MKRLVAVAVAGAAASIAATAAAEPQAAAASQCRPGDGLTRTAVGRSDLFVLDVGPTEAMYTVAQVKKLHPKTGEVMLGGAAMSMPGAMAGGQGGKGMAAAMQRHLEVHICSRATGKVVSDARPLITLTDATSMSMAERVPAAMMEGVDAGPGDIHYGNNVTLTKGHRYTVAVALGTEKVVFHITA